MKTSSDKTCLRHLRLAGLEPAFPNLAGGLSIPYPLAHNSLKPYSNMSTFLIKKLKVMERGRRFGVHKRPLGSSVSQDHTSQDHFCSLIDEFLTRNLDSCPATMKSRDDWLSAWNSRGMDAFTSCPVSRHWGSFCLFEHLQISQSFSEWSKTTFFVFNWIKNSWTLERCQQYVMSLSLLST